MQAQRHVWDDTGKWLVCNSLNTGLGFHFDDFIEASNWDIQALKKTSQQRCSSASCKTPAIPQERWCANIGHHRQQTNLSILTVIRSCHQYLHYVQLLFTDENQFTAIYTVSPKNFCISRKWSVNQCLIQIGFRSMDGFLVQESMMHGTVSLEDLQQVQL